MIADCVLFLAEDEAEADRIKAKNDLESYVYSLRNSLSDVKAKLPDKADDIASLEKEVDELAKWLDDNQQAAKDEYEERRKELEQKAMPLMKSFYEQGGAGAAPGGFPGAAPGGFPGGAPGAGAAAEDGPSVEEVD